MTIALIILTAVLLDWLFGDPHRGHPVAAFGRLAGALEARLNGGGHRKLRGLVAWSGLVIPAGLAGAGVGAVPGAGPFLTMAVLFYALGGRSLAEHGRAVARPLAAGDIQGARVAVGRMVGRDTAGLDGRGIAAAGVESVLENGADGVFAPLFWFAVTGPGGAAAYRAANTLDAMWGHRDERLKAFGWTAARADDLLNAIPAVLTALSYALVGRPLKGLRCAARQGWQWPSPNAGVVMAAGAGSLGIRVGGVSIYGGQRAERPTLGAGGPPDGAAITRAVALIERALILWLVVILIGGWLLG